MLYLFIKAAISGVLIAIASETARRYPGWGALLASLPLVSILGMMWLWRDTNDLARLGDHSIATFWFVLPSLPMFLVIPWLFKRGFGFWSSLSIGSALTVILYLVMISLLTRAGVKL